MAYTRLVFLAWLFTGWIAIAQGLNATAHPVLWGVAAAPVVLLGLGAVLVLGAALIALFMPARGPRALR